MYTEKRKWTDGEVTEVLNVFKALTTGTRTGLAKALEIAEPERTKCAKADGTRFDEMDPKVQAVILARAVHRNLPWRQACSNTISSWISSPDLHSDRNKVLAALRRREKTKNKGRWIPKGSTPLLLCIWDSFHNNGGAFVPEAARHYQMFASVLCCIEKNEVTIAGIVKKNKLGTPSQQPLPWPVASTPREEPVSPVAELAALDAVSTPATPAIGLTTKAGAALAGTLYGGKFPRYVEKIESGQYTDRSAALAAVAGSQALTPAGRVRLNELIDHKYPPTTSTAPTVPPPPPRAELSSSVQALYSRLDREIAAAPDTAKYVLGVLLEAHAAEVDLPSLAKKYGSVIHSIQRAQA